MAKALSYRDWSLRTTYLVCRFSQQWAIRVLAAPLSFRSTTITSATSTMQQPAATATSTSSSGNRNTFQAFAAGTQDLAALVGLFATDSVERYGFDYTQGWLMPALATCSLLGFLGYVRALLKLALGRERCKNAGYDTTFLRPFFGVNKSNNLPSDQLFQVSYLERSICEDKDSVCWTVVKRLEHTADSFAILADFQNSDHSHNKYYSIYRASAGTRSQYSRYENFPSPRFNYLSHFMPLCLASLYIRISLFFRRIRDHTFPRLSFRIFGSLGSLALFTGITSFSIIPLASGPPSWARYYASLGMFLPVLISATTWAWIFRTEHINYRDLTAGERPRCVLKIGNAFVKSNCHAVSDSKLRVARGLSLAASAAMTFAYACQYIEISQTTATKSGIWLGIQGILALVRVVLWMFPPKFQKYGHWTFTPEKQASDQINEEELVRAWHVGNFYNNNVRCLSIPNKITRLNIHEILKLSKRFRSGEESSSDKEEIKKASLVWTMEENASREFLKMRANMEPSSAYGTRVTKSSQDLSLLSTFRFSLLFLQTEDGKIHLFPACTKPYTGPDNLGGVFLLSVGSLASPTEPKFLLILPDRKYRPNLKGPMEVFYGTIDAFQHYDWRIPWRPGWKREYSILMHAVDNCDEPLPGNAKPRQYSGVSGSLVNSSIQNEPSSMSTECALKATEATDFVAPQPIIAHSYDQDPKPVQATSEIVPTKTTGTDGYDNEIQRHSPLDISSTQGTSSELA